MPGANGPLTVDAGSADHARLPLTGVRVVEFGQYIAIPGATQILLDQGATVIKVEPPGGEACRRLAGLGPGMFHAYNRGKRMVEIDLSEPEGLAAARQLVAGADLVMSNMKPGALARHGLSADEMRAADPALVVLTLTGFGDTGPMQTRPGLDIAAQAESGMMWVTGAAGGDPQRVGFTVVDAASATVAAQAATAALLHRFRTGEGAHIKVSLWDVALHLQAPNWMSWFLTGDDPVRSGNGQPAAAPAADVVPTATGYVVLSAYMPHQWQALCAAIGRPDLLTDARFGSSPDRARNRAALLAELTEALAGRSSDDVVELLTHAGVVVGAIRDYPGAFAARTAIPGAVFLPAPEDAPAKHYVGTPVAWEGTNAVAVPPRGLGADNDLLDLGPAALWQRAALASNKMKEEA